MQSAGALQRTCWLGQLLVYLTAYTASHLYQYQALSRMGKQVQHTEATLGREVRREKAFAAARQRRQWQHAAMLRLRRHRRCQVSLRTGRRAGQLHLLLLLLLQRRMWNPLRGEL